MIVIKHNKTTDKIAKVKYPGIWPNAIIGLDKHLKFYEIKESKKPAYNPNQYNSIEKIELTKNKGELLPIAIIDWELFEISQPIVVSNFNAAFGQFIDNAYPIWQRIKDLNYPTDDGALRKAQEASLRDERQQREDNYINNNIFPDFNFTWL